MNITENKNHAMELKPKTYHCGTLTYTKFGLFALFAWLLWGDFCFSLMEAVVPSIMPLKLKTLGCPNWLLGMIMTTVPGILNIGITPYLSFKSDRYRSRWGRRLPFIIWTLPFLSASLCLLGFSEDISVVLQRNSLFLQQFAPATIAIGVICVFITVFQFFNMFVNTVFWYLFNDVVPPQFLARFLGAFRIAGTCASALYSYFIFQYAESNMREILLGASILYFIGFSAMTLMVKEGQYPPIEDESDNKNKGMGSVKTYFKESFSTRVYWLTFLLAGVQAAAGSIGTFNIFFNREMGLSLKQFGQLGAISSVAALVTMYFTAIFVDRWQPMRVNTYITVFALVSCSMGWVWPFINIPADCYFWLCLSTIIITSFQGALAGACGFPMLMRLFPQSRFGQFCSAYALVGALFRLPAGMAAGFFIDIVRYYCNGTDYAYRFLFAWTLPFNAIAAGIAVYIYICWYRLGGDANYHPPTPWSKKKIEEMPIIPTVGPQSRWLDIALRTFNALMLSSIAIVPFMMWWMYHKHAIKAFFWHGCLILPASIAVWLLWKWLENKIRLDMKRSRESLPPLHGIPHHGVLMVVAVTYLSELVIWVMQIFMTVNLNRDASAIVFGIAHVVVNLMLTVCVLVLSKAERSYPMVMDATTLENT
ncbi:MAG: MFS transporter [Victivallaceae bacterium]|jgi:MFS family permease